mgnify:CR=1 FL=1
MKMLIEFYCATKTVVFPCENHEDQMKSPINHHVKRKRKCHNTD